MVVGILPEYVGPGANPLFRARTLWLCCVRPIAPESAGFVSCNISLLERDAGAYDCLMPAEWYRSLT